MADPLLSNDPALQRLRRSHPATYGKRQGKRPPRWLSVDEKAALLAACDDGTLVGLRDEIAIRLGLNAMRDHEIRSLPIGAVDSVGVVPTGSARATSLGRRHSVLHSSVPWTGTSTSTRTRRRTRFSSVLAVRGQASAQLQWGKGLSGNGVYRIVTERAEIAGLGHVAPHDLRRSAAGILHRTKTAEGGHLFDLLDIQKVLGHSDP
ncbi:MAG TPA: tyrosine-type recombinase/integrase, partial [Acidimicrobiales bacterium]